MKRRSAPPGSDMRHGERIKALLAHAAKLGVSAHVAYLPRDRRGVYDDINARVIYAIDLTPIEQVSVFAHELGHAYYRHTCTADPDAERQADIYAARLLIDPEIYADLERLSSDVEWIAEELGVRIDPAGLSPLGDFEAVAANEPFTTLPFVRPGGDILLKVESWPKVERVLQVIDAVEALGIVVIQAQGMGRDGGDRSGRAAIPADVDVHRARRYPRGGDHP